METANVTRVLNWATVVGLFEESTPQSQIEKTIEKVGALRKELLMVPVDKAEIQNELAGCIVPLIIIAEMLGLSVDECLSDVATKIESRVKGGKVIDGIFVNADDLALAELIQNNKNENRASVDAVKEKLVNNETDN